MKLEEITQGMAIDTLSDIIAPELLARFIVRNHPVMPIPVGTIMPPPFPDIEAVARIRAVGVGPLGVGMVQLLSRNLPGIICHEIIFDPKCEGSEQMTDLLSSLSESDLLFVLTGFEDEQCGAVARAVGCSARKAGVLTLAVIPAEGGSPHAPAELIEAFDVVFPVSDGSLAAMQEPLLLKKDTLTGYSMRHLVTVITSVIHQRSFICVDFADIVAIMRGGSHGRLGVGVASGPAKGLNAAKLALDRLTAQGVSTLAATGVLAIVQGSSLFTMDDFDGVSRVFHDHVAEDANLIIGFVTDDQMGNNVKVSVMSLKA